MQLLPTYQWGCNWSESILFVCCSCSATLKPQSKWLHPLCLQSSVLFPPSPQSLAGWIRILDRPFLASGLYIWYLCSRISLFTLRSIRAWNSKLCEARLWWKKTRRSWMTFSFQCFFFEQTCLFYYHIWGMCWRFITVTDINKMHKMFSLGNISKIYIRQSFETINDSPRVGWAHIW